MLKIAASDLATSLWSNAEQCKELRGDLVTFHSLGHPFAGQIGVPASNCGEVIERLVLLVPVVEVRGRRFHAVRILLRDRFPDNCDLQIREHEWPEEQGIDIAEY